MVYIKSSNVILILLHVTQTKLYELEGQVRRGADEMKKKKEFEQVIEKQKDQISNIQSLYKSKLEGAEISCSQHKVHTNKTGDNKTFMCTNATSEALSISSCHKGILGPMNTLFWFTHCWDSHHINILSGKNFIWTINKCDKWVLTCVVCLCLGHTAAEHFLQCKNHTGTQR